MLYIFSRTSYILIHFPGLIDEIFGINNSTANFPIDNFLSTEERSTESLSEDKRQIILNSADRLYADIRDKNFNAVSLDNTHSNAPRNCLSTVVPLLIFLHVLYGMSQD